MKELRLNVGRESFAWGMMHRQSEVLVIGGRSAVSDGCCSFGSGCCGFTAVICRQAFFLLLPFVPLFRVLSPRRLRRKKERLRRRKSRFLLCTVCENKGGVNGGLLAAGLLGVLLYL